MYEKLKKFEDYLKMSLDVNGGILASSQFSSVKKIYEGKQEAFEDILETFRLFGLSQEVIDDELLV